MYTIVVLRQVSHYWKHFVSHKYYKFRYVLDSGFGLCCMIIDHDQIDVWKVPYRWHHHLDPHHTTISKSTYTSSGLI